MSEPLNPEPTKNEPKKVNLAEAIKSKLNQKKAQSHAFSKNMPHQKIGNFNMKNQNNKKMNTMRRKTGGS